MAVAVRRRGLTVVVCTAVALWLVTALHLIRPDGRGGAFVPSEAARYEILTRKIERLEERLPVDGSQDRGGRGAAVAPFWFFRTCRQPASIVAFLKMHKCASSTIQNILLRYGEKHGLTFALPAKSHIFPLRTPFEAALVHTNAPFHTDLVNIFAMHTKWNKREIAKILYPGAVYFTIVREPKRAFLSLYDYFAFSTYYKMNASEYILTHDIETERMMGCLSYNIMACDFGAMPGDYSNQQAIVNLTRQMDDDFDLVMVAERMEESLVLLAHLLCWSYDDVVAVSANTRSAKKITLSPEADAALSDRLAPDYNIYNYFSKKFDELVKAFGEERMAKEVKELRQVTKAKVEGCKIQRVKRHDTDGPEVAGASKVDELKTNSSHLDCKAMVRPEQAFVGRIKKRQERRLQKP